MEREKKEFTFEIWYFKANGKFYTGVTVSWPIRDLSDTPGHLSACMNDAVAKLRGLRDTGGPNALPGLSSSGWEGFIVINCEHGCPCLIRPNEG